MSSDHFSPWSARQGESGFAWSWLGAAMARTSLPFGVVNAPGQRYHPAIVAQAAATLAEMFPRRLWVALGTGEASNEHITGGGWPAKSLRTRRLAECVEVIRALFAGEEVTHHGLVTVDRARLWTLPAEPPLLIGAAVSEQTAAWVGTWADGLATVGQPVDDPAPRARRVPRARWRRQTRVSPGARFVGADRRRGVAIAHDQWRTNVFAPPVCWDLELVEHFDVPRRTSGPRTSPSTCSCQPIRRGTSTGWPSSSPSGSTASGSTMSARTSCHSSTRSASTSCRAAGSGVTIAETADMWWKNAVIYCLDVQTFCDSDGDGIGDFAGLTSKVDYLAGLGVTCIWLMPFYPTADADDGYDVTEHYGIDPRLGTFGDFTEFVRTARDRGLRVIVDLVVNHTSDKHPWFQEARRSRESPIP